MVETLHVTGTITYKLKDCTITFYISYRADQFDVSLEVLEVDEFTCGDIVGEDLLYNGKKVNFKEVFFTLDEYATSAKSIIEVLEQETFEIDKTLDEIIRMRK